MNWFLISLIVVVVGFGVVVALLRWYADTGCAVPTLIAYRGHCAVPVDDLH